MQIDAELKAALADIHALVDQVANTEADDREESRQGMRSAVARFADALARYARARGTAYPAKSAAGWIREHVAGGLVVEGRSLRSVLGGAADEALGRIASPLPPGDRAADEAEVADFIGISLDELRGLLRTVAGRRGLWWPLHIGEGRFRWPRPFLLDPVVQAARSAGPEPPHPCPLPAGYSTAAGEA